MSVNLVNSPSPSCALYWKSNNRVIGGFALPKQLTPSSTKVRSYGALKAFFFNPSEDPIIKEALKEPVAFMGGMFAGILRLDLNEDPLKDWVSRTVEASGITEEEIDADGLKPEEETPKQIEIE